MSWLNLSLVAAASVMVAFPCMAQTGQPFDQALYAKPGELVDIGGGRRLNLVCQGSGSPTVIFEAGFGETSVTWRYVQGEIAKLTRACAYDRAGLGFSDPTPEPQNLPVMTRDLHKMLVAAKIERPIVLVAHSMGGMNAVYFADRHLDDLAGMVLVDPAVANQEKLMAPVTQSYYQANAGQRALLVKCLAAAKVGDITPGSKILADCGNVTAGADAALAAVENGWSMTASYWQAMLSEHENMFSMNAANPTRDDRELDAAKGSFNALPLIVLTAGNAMPNMPEAERGPANALWMQLHDRLAANSTVGVNRLIPKSGHYIQDDDPKAVIAAITEVLAAARK